MAKPKTHTADSQTFEKTFPLQFAEGSTTVTASLGLLANQSLNILTAAAHAHMPQGQTVSCGVDGWAHVPLVMHFQGTQGGLDQFSAVHSFILNVVATGAGGPSTIWAIRSDGVGTPIVNFYVLGMISSGTARAECPVHDPITGALNKSMPKKRHAAGARRRT